MLFHFRQVGQEVTLWGSKTGVQPTIGRAQIISQDLSCKQRDGKPNASEGGTIWECVSHHKFAGTTAMVQRYRDNADGAEDMGVRGPGGGAECTGETEGIAGVRADQQHNLIYVFKGTL